MQEDWLYKDSSNTSSQHLSHALLRATIIKFYAVPHYSFEIVCLAGVWQVFLRHIFCDYLHYHFYITPHC